MKKIYSLLLATLAAYGASAQVTLTQSSYSNMPPVSSDTFGGMQSFPQLTTGANQSWDLSQVPYNKTYYQLQYSDTNAAFPNATTYSPREYKAGTYDSLLFKTNRWTAITSTGFQRVGEESERYAINLDQFGLASTDSLVILKQNAPYSAPYNLIKFPATLNSSWAESFDMMLNMELTIGAQSLSHAPFVWKTHTDYTFTCPGEGKALIARFDASLGEADALLERISGTTTDSFFVNGSPAAPGVLSNLGLTQGKVTNNNFAELFRANELNALVLYLFGNDNTFTNTQSGQVQVLRVPFPASVQSISKDGSMSLYPNPVGSGRQVFVKLNAPATGTYSYTVSLVTGAVVAKGDVQAQGGNELAVALPTSLASGVYWLSLHDGKGNVQTAPFRVQE